MAPDSWPHTPPPPQIASKAQRLMSLEVDASAGRSSTDRLHAEMSALGAEKNRLAVEVLTLGRLKEAA